MVVPDTPTSSPTSAARREPCGRGDGMAPGFSQAPRRIRSGGLPGGQRVDRLRGERLPADGPVPAADLVDDAPGHAAHVLALDADHGVGEPFADLRLLLGGEDALDDLDVDERHDAPP